MGSDNVDIFKHIVFKLPSLPTQIIALVVLSPLYATLMYLALNKFAPIEIQPWIIPVGAIVIFLGPFFIAAELFYHSLPDYPRHWSYFLALTTQLFLFIYALILSGADTGMNAWQIIWLALITVSLTNVSVLTVSVGSQRLGQIILLSLSQPLLLIGVFQFFIGQNIGVSEASLLVNFGVLLAVVVILVLFLKLFDYLIGNNANVSAFRLTSGLLKGERSALDLGYPARPDVQTLTIDNGKKLTLAAPWIHPGPLGGFGGGKLSSEVIERLNDTGTGFFLHVPCTHKEDLADPADVAKVIDAIGNPETVSTASRLHSLEHDDLHFYGRTVDGKKIVFFEAEGIDDYHPGVFMRNISKDDVLLVDMHNHHIHAELDREIQYGTEDAARLKRCFDDFLELLEDAETYPYSVGFAVHCDEHPLMALVEEVDGQRTLLFGVDTNGITDDLREQRERLQQEFDDVILFSTDTHASVHDLANMKGFDVATVTDTVQHAVERVSDARIGLTNVQTDRLRLLKLDYSGLVFSVNILIRLAIISLVAFYASLVLWVF
ncbi:DUF2070 family protein [Natronococcus jeotgali]|uniref:DUF2070 domain-containing protein n=1 Tax=Natronococcus jeotgali DSM 18795 TaxID=1227498 RepID=L9XCF5_9EURY|nr:DUF2070 family protein [Natronococcus jeotgali]ELY59322.1 hypothetical protein C492_11315 [Natronococcus jeotgali DSM 18795]